MSTYLSLYVHVVFSTKDRRPLITTDLQERFHSYITGTARGLGSTPVAVGGVADHVHLLLRLKSTHCVSDLVRETKKTTSSWYSEKNSRFAWQSGYGAFSVSARDLNAVADYVRRQEEHHRRLSSTEELLRLLEENGVEYDPKYFE